MDGNNPPAGGTATNIQPALPSQGGNVNYTQNNNWGNINQGRAGRQNGPIQVNDSLNQNYIYHPQGNNEPLLSNKGKALLHQKNLGNTNLSSNVFTPSQEHFILQHLLHTNRPMYDKIMGIGESYNAPYNDTPKW